MKTIYLPEDITYKIFHNLKRYAPITTIEVKKSFFYLQKYSIRPMMIFFCLKIYDSKCIIQCNNNFVQVSSNNKQKQIKLLKCIF